MQNQSVWKTIDWFDLAMQKIVWYFGIVNIKLPLSVYDNISILTKILK